MTGTRILSTWAVGMADAMIEINSGKSKFVENCDAFHFSLLLRSHLQDGCLSRTNGSCSDLVRV
jgi:hypothetical protein